MAAITLTGKLTLVELKRISDPDYLGVRRYSPNTERYLHYLNCCLEVDGQRYYFDSPKVQQTVSNAPGVSVVCFFVEGSASDWFIEVEGSGVATSEKANTNSIEALVKVGDVITIRASVKATKPRYTSLNRVKRLNKTTATNQ